MIETRELFTEDECAQIHATLQDLRPFWEKTSPFGRTFVLGAASYIHANGEMAGARYHDRRARLNPVLAAHLGWMYRRLERTLAEHLGDDVVVDERLGLPGFHLYFHDRAMHLLKCSVHLDLQWRSHDWKPYGAAELDRPVSFTVGIRLPHAGAGMNVWDLTQAAARGLKRPEIDAKLAADGARPVRYRLGELNLHSGLFFHQIAQIVLEPGESRLTLQGHAIRAGGVWRVYW
jgi:hypothetical protein